MEIILQNIGIIIGFMPKIYLEMSMFYHKIQVEKVITNVFTFLMLFYTFLLFVSLIFEFQILYRSISIENIQVMFKKEFLWNLV